MQDLIKQSIVPTDSSAQVLDAALLPKQGSSINFQVLGEAGRDNALFVKISNGRQTQNFLFDCGAQCLNQLPWVEIQNIDALFFSHLHIDHIAGFDEFIRANYNRDRPVQIYGPPGTAEIIQHRLQGVLWDRAGSSESHFLVTDISSERNKTFAFYLKEGFKVSHKVSEERHSEMLVDDALKRITVIELDHGTPSLGYVLHEKDSANINIDRMAKLGLQSGSWMKQLKDSSISGETLVQTPEGNKSLAELREVLLDRKKGESIAYLTDFRVKPEYREKLVELIRDCDTVVCENNYRDEHKDLADKHSHAVSSEVGALAHDANPKQLIIIHVSNRYDNYQLKELLAEVRKSFPMTTFPEGWVF